jgi:HK97 gp10 family phage protein
VGPARVEVTGLASLLRDLKKLEPEVYKELRSGLKNAGQIVADEAKRNASSLFRKRTGDLSRKITPAVKQKEVVVRAKAKHRGYDYPGRLEFDPARARPFLYPALDAKVNEARAAIDAAVGLALRKSNL